MGTQELSGLRGTDVPHANRAVRTRGDNVLSVRMVDGVGDFLLVTLEHGDDLLAVLVEDDRLLVVSTGDEFGAVLRIDVESQDSGSRRGMDRGLRLDSFVALDVVWLGESFREISTALLTLSSEQRGAFREFLQVISIKISRCTIIVNEGNVKRQIGPTNVRFPSFTTCSLKTETRQKFLIFETILT